MAARRRDFQRALYIFLALDLGKIVLVVGRMLKEFGDIHLGRRDFDFAFQKLRGFAEILHRNDLQAVHHRGLRGVFGGNQNAGLAVRLRAQGNRQNPFARRTAPVSASSPTTTK